MTTERVIAPTRTCVRGCGRSAHQILHVRGKHKTWLCWPCADRVMFELSLQATSLDGASGFQRWRRDVGMPIPLSWPRYDPLPPGWFR